MELRGGGCGLAELAKVLDCEPDRFFFPYFHFQIFILYNYVIARPPHIAKVLHTDRPSDEPGCRGAIAPKKTGPDCKNNGPMRRQNLLINPRIKEN